MERWKLIRDSALPAAVLAAAGLLISSQLSGEGALVTRGTWGPYSWPRAMLFGIVLCAALLLCQKIGSYLGNRGPFPSHPAPQDGEAPGGRFGDADASPGIGDDQDNRRAAAAIGALAVYGIAIPSIGFAFATLAFMPCWLWLGGVRRYHVLVGVSLLGTAGIVYFFARIATMPLDRGIGYFDTLSVALYRLLGIY